MVSLNIIARTTIRQRLYKNLIVVRVSHNSLLSVKRRAVAALSAGGLARAAYQSSRRLVFDKPITYHCEKSNPDATRSRGVTAPGRQALRSLFLLLPCRRLIPSAPTAVRRIVGIQLICPVILSGLMRRVVGILLICVMIPVFSHSLITSSLVVIHHLTVISYVQPSISFWRCTT